MTLVVIGVIWVFVAFVLVALMAANRRVHARADRRAAESIRDVEEFRDGHRQQRVARDGERTPRN